MKFKEEYVTNNTSGTSLFTSKNIRESGIIIGVMIGMIFLLAWYMPIGAAMAAKPILDNLSNAKTCQDVYRTDVQQFMIPMMISLDPVLSKKVSDMVQEKAHKFCPDLFILEKKYGDISDSSTMSCNDLKIIVRDLPSDMIKSSVMNDYVSRCLTHD